MLRGRVFAAGLVVLVQAACQGEPRSLLVVEVTKEASVGVLSRLQISANGLMRTEAGDAPQKIGVYFPASFTGQVEVVVTGFVGEGAVARGRASAKLSPGERVVVKTLLTLLNAAGQVDGGGVRDALAARDSEAAADASRDSGGAQNDTSGGAPMVGDTDGADVRRDTPGASADATPGTGPRDAAAPDSAWPMADVPADTAGDQIRPDAPLAPDGPGAPDGAFVDVPADAPSAVPDAPADALPNAPVDALSDATCTPECTLGATRCGAALGLETCVVTAGCLGWAAEVACPTGRTCQGMAPTAMCACPLAAAAIGAGCAMLGGTACYGTTSALCGNDGSCQTWQSVATGPVAGAGSITGPAAVCQGQTGVGYSIATVANATGYTWTYSAGIGFSVSAGANTNAVTASFSASATSGTLSVYGTNACGLGSASATLSVTVGAAPAAPIATAATGVTPTGFTATWNSVPGATGYFLDVATDAGFTTLVAGNNNRNVGAATSVAVSGVAGTAYYRVRATGVCGMSGSSNTVTVTPPGPPKAWGTATLVETDDIGGAHFPRVAMDGGGNAFAVWAQFDASQGHAYANRYVPGTGWTGAVRIDTGGAMGASLLSVAADGTGNAIAVWEGTSASGRRDIWANRYVSGVGWGTAAPIESDNTGDAAGPEVAMDSNGNAVAVWTQLDGIRWNAWSNRYVVGMGWGTPELIETDNAGSANLPRVAVVRGSGETMATWCQSDGTRLNVWTNRYVPGVGWGTATLIETDNSGDAVYAWVALDSGGNGTVVWAQHNGARSNIMANRYVSGVGWGTASLIESGSGISSHPAVVTDASGNVLAVWYQQDSVSLKPWMNWYKPGMGWGVAAPIEATAVGGSSSTNGPPSVAFDPSGSAVVVWQQQDTTGYNIWAKRYTPVGGWGAGGLLETSSGAGQDPRVVVDANGNAIAVWEQQATSGPSRADVWSNRLQ